MMSLWWQAADIVTSVGLGLLANASLVLDHDDGLEIGPPVVVTDVFRSFGVSDGLAAAGFNPTAHFIDSLVVNVRHILEGDLVGIGKPFPNVIIQIPLIFLHG